MEEFRGGIQCSYLIWIKLINVRMNLGVVIILQIDFNLIDAVVAIKELEMV